MAGLNSWLSHAVMHALGWALIHSLWQCAAAAALAALAMAFTRRPAVRYLIGVGALALMLAAPLATFLVLARPVAPVQALHPATASLLPALSTAYPVAVFAGADRAIGAMRQAPRPFALPDILPWLVAAWSCGVAVFSLRFAGGFLLLEHRRRTQSQIPGARVLALCQALQRQLGLDRAIQYLECGWVEAPAVIGWLRPAVLLPVFALTGLSEEQFKAVIAHELAHIRRHDWLVNLFQVLVETLLFYHPAMWWLNRRIRIERELCCDEIAVSLTGSRLEYARALAQMAEWKNVSMLAMAANRGPLTQRILHVLGRKPSGAGQRVAGLTGGVLFLTAALAAANLLFGITYPIPAKAEIRAVLVSSQSVALRMARHVFPVSEPAVKIAAPQIATPDKVEAASGSQPENLTAPAPDLSRLLPNQSLATPAVVASNAAPATPQPSPNVPSAVAPDDQPGIQPTTRDPSVGSAQAGLSAPPATLPDFDPNKPYDKTRCTVANNTVMGRVTSSTTIQMPRFVCTNHRQLPIYFNFGWCKNPVITSLPWRRYCPPLLTMTVQFANPADARTMPLGKLVTVKGDFLVITQNKVQYLLVQNARVLYVDPFDRHVEADQPAQVSPAAPNSEPAAFTLYTVQAPVISASNALTAGPAAGPQTVTPCRNSSVFGRVMSPTAIEMQGFTCFTDANGNGSSLGPRDIALGGCPLASTTDAHKTGCVWDVTLNVRLADKGDAAKMQPGKLVRLGGNFSVVRKGQAPYLVLENGKVLFVDFFWTGRSQPAPDIQPFYMSVQGPSMPAGNSASGDPIGQIHGIGN